MGIESVDDAAKIIAAGKTPSAVVLEAGLPGTNYETLEQLVRRVPVIVVASRWDRVPLESAAAVLYRPVRVGDVVNSILQVLQGRPA